MMRQISVLIVPILQSDVDRDRGAFARGGVNSMSAAEHPHALRDAEETEAGGPRLGRAIAGNKTTTVIPDRQPHLPGMPRDRDLGFSRSRMLDDVVNRFLHDPVEADLRFFRKQSVNLCDL